MAWVNFSLQPIVRYKATEDEAEATNLHGFLEAFLLKELVALCLESVSHDDERDAGSEEVDEVRKLEKNSNGVQVTGGVEDGRKRSCSQASSFLEHSEGAWTSYRGPSPLNCLLLA